MHTLSFIYGLIQKKCIEPVPFEWQIFMSQWQISSIGNWTYANTTLCEQISLQKTW